MTLAEYLNNLSHARRRGYATFYTVAAETMGGIGIGFLAPFKAVRSYIVANDFLSLFYLEKEVHRQMKTNNIFYRSLNHYIKLFDIFNQELCMRPIANVAGMIGGAAGFGLGLFTSVFHQNYSEAEKAGVSYFVTAKNKYFSRIKVEPRSERRWTAFVWAGLAGMAIGTYFTAPVAILGNTIQGAAGLGGFFASTAATLVDLPYVLKDLFNTAKKIFKFLNKTLGFTFENTSKAIKWIGAQIKTLATKVVNHVIKQAPQPQQPVPEASQVPLNITTANSAAEIFQERMASPILFSSNQRKQASANDAVSEPVIEPSEAARRSPARAAV